MKFVNYKSYECTNIHNYIKAKGYEIHVPEVKLWSDVQVIYIDDEGYENEVTFRIKDALSKGGKYEVGRQFNKFCKNENIKKDSVAFVNITDTGDSEDIPVFIAAAA